jgi:hypothetical protein
MSYPNTGFNAHGLYIPNLGPMQPRVNIIQPQNVVQGHYDQYSNQPQNHPNSKSINEI